MAAGTVAKAHGSNCPPEQQYVMTQPARNLILSAPPRALEKLEAQKKTSNPGNRPDWNNLHWAQKKGSGEKEAAQARMRDYWLNMWVWGKGGGARWHVKGRTAGSACRWGLLRVGSGRPAPHWGRLQDLQAKL